DEVVHLCLYACIFSTCLHVVGWSCIQLFGYAVCLLKSILKELQLCGDFIDNVRAAP
ncbi:unnamed protein product, partial [Prunus brigantina]